MRNTLTMAITGITVAVFGPNQADARLLGVDVYAGDGNINWSNASQAGIAFAWAKATQGNYYQDANFAANMNNGKAAGVYMGAYDFGDPGACSPSTEANYFWGYAKNYISNDRSSLTPVLDFEDFDGHTGTSSYSAWANQWCTNVQSLGSDNGLSITPVIYISACSTGNLDSSDAGTGNWIADYNDESWSTGSPWDVSCSPNEIWGSGVWDFWQFSSSATVAGVPGDSLGQCDEDTFNGNVNELVDWFVPGSYQSPGDFDGDTMTDYALYNPVSGEWSVRSSQGAGSVSTFYWGGGSGFTNDIPLIGNWSTAYGAEGAVYRPSTGEWYVRFQDGGSSSFSWGGNAGDIPLIGAWTGQMRDEVIFRPSNGAWYIRFGNTGDSATVNWGGGSTNLSDKPLVGDFSGNGMIDQVIFRPSTGAWYVRNGQTGAGMPTFYWGGGAGFTNDIPLLGAWSGQMRDAVAFRPSTGMWYIRFGDTGQTTQFQFGQAGDEPMVGNIFGHGMIDEIVFRPSTGVWYVRDGKAGTVYNFSFGNSQSRLVHE